MWNVFPKTKSSGVLNWLFLELEFQLSVAEEVEGAAVVGGDAVQADGVAVLLGGVALVGKPVVLGVFLGELVYVVVAVGLGEDAGGGY